LARGAGLAQGAQHFASEPVYFDYPAGWAVTTDRSNPQLSSYVLARPGLDAQITLYVAPNEISAPASAVPTLLDAARTSLVLPLIEQYVQPLEAIGAQVQRTRARTDVGGSSVDGDRWIVTAAGQSVTLEAYLLTLHNHLVIVALNQPTNAAPQVAPAWELLRRTLSIGAPAAATAAPTPNAAAPDNLPSLAVMEQMTAALTEINRLTQQAIDLRNAGKYAEAVVPAEQALAVAEKAAQLDLPAEMKVQLVAGSSNVLGELRRATGDYTRAAALLQHALDITEQLKGPDDRTLAPPLNNLATLYYETGDYDKSEALFRRAVAISEKTKGPDDPATATAINNLALVYDAKNDYAQEERLLQRALTIRERKLGAEHEDTAISLANLGTLYDTMGDPVRAEPYMRRALAALEKTKGPDHPDTATALNNLGSLYRHRGDYPQAEQFYQRALAIDEKAYGPDHAALAPIIDNIAQLYFEKGDTARAETFYRRALTIRERKLGADHPDVAQSLSNLAFIYQERGDYAQAEQLNERARTIFEQKFGPNHLSVATTLNNLAAIYRSAGQPERGIPIATRAKAIYEKLSGPESPDVALALNNIGSLTLANKDAPQALALHQRALQLYEHAYGATHPNLSIILSNLSTDYYALGDMTHAVETQARANEISERQLALALATGSEEQKRLFVATLAEESDYTLALHAVAAPTSLPALRLALTTILRRKGRVLDAMSDQIAVLRRRLKPEDRILLERLSTANAELAALVLKGAGKQTPAEYQERLAKLNTDVNDLQAQISARSTEFRAQAQPVTLEAVQQAIPAGAALVEFAVYRPYNAQGKNRQERFGAPRYVAYVMRAGVAPTWVALGEAAALDQAISAWRTALADPHRSDVKQLARTLDEKLMQPVRRLLGDTHQLFLSPDGALNLIPFGALVDEQNKYLVETYTLTYLTSGRDLLRLAVRTESKQGAVVFADPSFDAGGAGADVVSSPRNGQQGAPDQTPSDNSTQRGTGRRSFDFASAHFARLPGTAEEGQAIGTILPGLRLLTGAQATESALKQLSGPQVLHVATHGFFLPDQPRAAAGGTRGLTPGATAALPSPGENPLLRSGLALAGANTRSSAGGEDGVLTALEASGLDLWGTRLVVLSACETGLGDVQSGEGVYGLRRALVLAGSESQVMSLWQVSDAATRDLMVAYYKRLQAGEGRTEALRQVQLAMIKSAPQGAVAGAQRGLSGEMKQQGQTEDRSHPFYWASFIQSGEWRSMSKQ
jgi:CHAT domain-containing protein/tetratricopeptide (TPR) repeat protein